MKKTNEFPPQQELPFLAHLIELRDRLLRVVLAVVIVFLALFSFANNLYTLLAEPLLRHMPAGTSMIATEVASPFLTPFKLTLVLSVFIAIPFILYQAWGFVAPALYQNERRLVFPLLLSSTLLFYLGMVFAYFVVFPLVFGFLTGVAPEGVAVMTDISRYLDFVLKMFFAFGVAFEVPIATILLIWTGMTTAKDLASKRPYIIVGAFVVGMLLTPPDVISQTLLAVPMWLLFELGLLFSKMYSKPASDKDEAATDDASDSTSDSTKASASTTTSSVVSSTSAAAQDDGKPATDYAEPDEEFKPLSEAEMEAELDRISREEELYNNEDQEVHEEFEPLPEDDAGQANLNFDAGSDEQGDDPTNKGDKPA